MHSTLVQTNFMWILVKLGVKMAIYRQNRAKNPVLRQKIRPILSSDWSYLVWVTRLELAASTTQIEKMEIISCYRLIFVGYVVFLSDIVLPEKYTSVHDFWRYEPKLCTKTLCTSRFVRLRTICIISCFLRFVKRYSNICAIKQQII